MPARITKPPIRKKLSSNVDHVYSVNINENRVIWHSEAKIYKINYLSLMVKKTLCFHEVFCWEFMNWIQWNFAVNTPETHVSIKHKNIKPLWFKGGIKKLNSEFQLNNAGSQNVYALFADSIKMDYQGHIHQFFRYNRHTSMRWDYVWKSVCRLCATDRPNDEIWK